MAELSDPGDSLPVVPCCAPEKQADCCSPSEKAKCCPPGAAGCGCQPDRKP
jgi:hypothetical protein